jgi:hypothetical protein
MTIPINKTIIRTAKYLGSIRTSTPNQSEQLSELKAARKKAKKNSNGHVEVENQPEAIEQAAS